ncbi:MAG: PAS domain-containing sensor histidine kinase [Bacteroidota bacterium]
MTTENSAHTFGAVFLYEPPPNAWMDWENIPNQFSIAGAWLVGLLFFALGVISLRVVSRTELSFPRSVRWFTAFSLTVGLYFFSEGLIYFVPLGMVSPVLLGLILLLGIGVGVNIYQEYAHLENLSPPSRVKAELQATEAALLAAEKELTDSKQQFEALVENNPDQIARLDLNFKHLFVNQALVRATGFPQEYYLGRRVDELDAKKEFMDNYMALLQQVVETKRTLKFEPDSIDIEDQSAQAFVVTVVPILNADKEVTDLLVVRRDITERKQAEGRLRARLSDLQELSKSLSEKHRQMEDFSHIVSHNLRSPVRNLRLLLEFYHQEKIQEVKEELIEKVGNVSQQLTNTLADLTEVISSQPSAEVVREELALQEILSGLEESLFMQVREAKAKISHDFDALERVYFPKVYLESALLNLLTNAIKYRHPDRGLHIHLHSWVSSGNMYLSVEDNGLGIDLELHGHRLFGLHNTFHDHEDSRGMGLFITRNQIEALGGKINVMSEVDKGSKFTLNLGQAQKPELV